MVALRTVVLPLVASAFNLLTAAATFGAMTLLFGGDDPVLGGPGYLDPMSVIGIFAAIFGISATYDVAAADAHARAARGGRRPPAPRSSTGCGGPRRSRPARRS